MKKLLSKLYKLFIKGRQKALVGFLVAALGTFAAKHGVDIADLTLKQAAESVFYGVLGWLAVYVKSNK